MREPTRKELASSGCIFLDEWTVEENYRVVETYYIIRHLGQNIRLAEREDAFKMFTEMVLNTK